MRGLHSIIVRAFNHIAERGCVSFHVDSQGINPLLHLAINFAVSGGSGVNVAVLIQSGDCYRFDWAGHWRKPSAAQYILIVNDSDNALIKCLLLS